MQSLVLLGEIRVLLALRPNLQEPHSFDGGYKQWTSRCSGDQIGG